MFSIARLYRLLVIFIVLIVILGIAPPGVAAPETSNLQSPLCVIPPENILGQPYEFPGGASGVTRDMADTEALGIVNYERILTQANLPFKATSLATRNVTILIVDDFERYYAPVNPVSGKTEFYWPHGDLVFQVARQWLDAMLGKGEFGRQEDGFTYHNQTITMIAVPVENYNAEAMLTNIQTQINNAFAPTDGSAPADAVIVNMSFGVFDCAVEVHVNNQTLVVDASQLKHIIETSDLLLSFRTDLTSVPQWQVVANGGELGNILNIGDRIIGFSIEDQLIPILDVWDLYRALNPLSTVDRITLDVVGKGSVQVNALDLYLALRGPSLSTDAVKKIMGYDSGAPFLDASPYYYINRVVTLQNQVEAALKLWLTNNAVTFNDLANIFTENPKVVGVAAAGNFDGIYPLYPGRWTNVISVGGGVTIPDITVGSVTYQNTRTTRWPDSSTGEVLAPGGWYELPCDLWKYANDNQQSTETQHYIDDHKCDVTGSVADYVAGTSFATPAVSAVVAISLVQQDCPGYHLSLANSTQHFDELYFKEADCPK